MTTKHTRCQQLGVCQGLGPDRCPDCDGWECEVPCAEPPAPTRPVAQYPFAPGVIEGAPQGRYIAPADDWFPLSPADAAKLIAVLAALSFLAGYLVEVCK